jgi:hypothetical protein
MLLNFLPLIVLAGVFVLIYLALKARKSNGTAYKSAVAVALIAAFLLFWVNGAVGIIGDSNNDANMLYFVVLGIGFFGGLITRCRPAGMAITLLLAAATQFSIGLTALLAGWGSSGPIWPKDVLYLTVFFTAMFLCSAGLFRQSTKI